MGHRFGLSFLERKDVVPKWGAMGETAFVFHPRPLPRPAPVPQHLHRLQCHLPSCVSWENHRQHGVCGRQPGKGCLPGEQVQAVHGHLGQEVGDRKGENGKGNQGKQVGEKDEVRKKGRHRVREGGRTGGKTRDGRQREGNGQREEREMGESKEATDMWCSGR